MTRQGRYPQEMRERAVRMALEHQGEHALPAVGRVAGATGDQLVDRDAKPPRLGRSLGGIQLASLAGIPCRQGGLEDAADRVRC